MIIYSNDKETQKEVRREAESQRAREANWVGDGQVGPKSEREAQKPAFCWWSEEDVNSHRL